MWKTVINVVKNQFVAPLLSTPNISQQQCRTTFILRRKYPPRLNKKGGTPKKLRSRNYIYELVKDTNTEKKSPLSVILTSYVEGVGNVGDQVEVKRDFGYNSLILPGLAVYASPENIEKYKNNQNVDSVQYSSPYALLTMKSLAKMTLSVVLNKENPWTLKPWHIKTSFRKCGIVVPEDAITLPEEPIKGPDMSLEGKEFFIVVTINKTENIKVRCQIHHWSTDLSQRLPHVHEFWKEPGEAILPSQSDTLQKMPKPGERVSARQLI